MSERNDWTGLREVVTQAQLQKLAREKAHLTVAAAFSLGALVVAAALVGMWLWAFAGLPRVPDQASLWSINRPLGITFVDERGAILAVRGPAYGQAVRLEALPPHVREAFLAVEDARFFEHRGIDRQALLRAAAQNLRSGRTVQGGSTITQQLVKNLFLSSDRTLRRKVQEMILATRIERELDKREILELYLNRVELGERAFGIDAAARRYFGKAAAEMTLAEAAMLAGLPKAPYRDNPVVSFTRAKQRQGVVLGAMVAAGFITEEDRARASAEVIAIAPQLAPEGDLGYALDLAGEEARRLARRSVNDLVVTITIDPAAQRIGSEMVREGARQASPKGKALQGALVALDREGRIRALVGGADYGATKFNRATQAKRQPGSTFKTFVYAAAFEADRTLTPDSVRYDEPIRIGSWRPKNYTGDYRDAVTLRTAFAQSLNTVAASLGQEVGLERISALAGRMGIRSELAPVPSLALGTGEVTLLELTAAFSTFQREGVRRDPYLVTKVADSRGEALFERPAPRAEPVYNAALARRMTGMMGRVLQNGTGVRAQLAGRDAAGKTGTSQDWRDAWFVGYTADYTAGVWVGFDDYSPMPQITGGTAPAEIWAAFMQEISADLPPKPLPGIEPLEEPSPRRSLVANFFDALKDAFSEEPPPPEDFLDSPYLQ